MSAWCRQNSTAESRQRPPRHSTVPGHIWYGWNFIFFVLLIPIRYIVISHADVDWMLIERWFFLFILLLGTLSRIWTEEGIRGLYRGLGPTIFGYLPTWAIYFTVYDYCKVRMGGRIGKPDDHWLVHILSAMTAGATSTSMTNPLWVIKTRFMVRLIGSVKITHTIWLKKPIIGHCTCRHKTNVQHIATIIPCMRSRQSPRRKGWVDFIKD